MTIDTVHSSSEAALVVAALGGAGIPVFIQNFHHTANAPHLAVAFRGMPVTVPASHADEARSFLAALAAGQVIAQDDTGADPTATAPPERPRWRLRDLLMAPFYLFTGTAPSLHGRFQREPPRNGGTG